MPLEIAVGIGLVLVVLALPPIVSLWRGRPSNDWVEVLAVFFGKAIARGLVRALPVLYAIVTASVFLVIAVPRTRAASPDLFDTIIGVFTIAYLMTWILAASIVLLNKPSVLVAPHLRKQAGAVEEWRAPRQGGPNT